MLYRIAVLGALLLTIAVNTATAETIDQIQSYDAVTGAPNSVFEGQSVSITGVVTVPVDVFAPDLFFVEDQTGGILVKMPTAPIGVLGHRVQITGTVVYEDGEILIEESSSDDLTAGYAAVRPTDNGLAGLAAGYDYVGTLIRTSGIVALTDSIGFVLTAAGDSLQVQVDPFTGVSVGAVQDGDTLYVAGALRVADGKTFIAPRTDFDVRTMVPANPYLLVEDGSGTFPDLATALEFAVSGDTIRLAPGVYQVHDQYLPTGISLRSSDGMKGSAVLDAAGQGRVLRLSVPYGVNGEEMVLEGITFCNGHAARAGAVEIVDIAGEQPHFIACIFENNFAQNGGGIANSYASPVFEDCDFVGNTAALSGGGAYLDVTSGIKTGYVSELDARFQQKVVSNPSFYNCLFYDNYATDGGAFSLNGFDSNVRFENCKFVLSHASAKGGMAYLSEGTAPIFEKCTVTGSRADESGCVFFFFDAGLNQPVSMLNCTVANNGHENGILLAGPIPAIAIENSILAFNLGAELLEQPHQDFYISCSDVYGNTAGDWLGPLAAFASTDSNFSANPLFCDLEAGDLSLADNSPCLPEFHPAGTPCGLIGVNAAGACGPYADDVAEVALTTSGARVLHPGDTIALRLTLRDASQAPTMETGIPPSFTGAAVLGTVAPLRLQPDYSWVSSFVAGSMAGTEVLVGQDPEAQTSPVDSLRLVITEAAIITSVRDIANDQGRQVRVRWRSDTRDTLGSASPVTQYVVWRRVEEIEPFAKRAVLQASDLTSTLMAERSSSWLLAYATSLWEPVGPAIPGMMWPEYASVVPTLVDSNAVGVAYSTFFVSAHTLQPQVFFSSLPDSGYSVDNLAPAAIDGLAKVVTGRDVTLHWLANTEPDFHSYQIYRGKTLQVQPTAEYFYASVSETNVSLPDGAGYLYVVTARDHAGNEGPPAAADAISGTGDAPLLGLRLYPNVPNPFNPVTSIAFDLPAAGAVDMRIFDVKGRLVRILVNGRHFSAGRHSATWDGRTSAGRTAAAGVYLVQIRGGGWQRSERMTLAK